jgi:hypothetical protein
MDDLEEMMMIEAIKLSLEAEEERKRKVEKEAAKEGKKRAKEEKKREKKERKGVYGSGASSAGGSTISLSLSSFGRRRGNSGGSNLAKEVTSESADSHRSKGKEADRGMGAPLTPITTGEAESGAAQNNTLGSRSPDTSSFPSFQDSHDSSTAAGSADKPSHLREISNTSSITSSLIESAPNSPHDVAPTPNISGTSSNNQEAGDANSSTGSNLRSLAAVISNGDEDEPGTLPHAEQPDLEVKDASAGPANTGLNLGPGEVTSGGADSSNSTGLHTVTPELVITPDTPAALSEGREFGKQLGSEMNGGAERIITQ